MENIEKSKEITPKKENQLGSHSAEVGDFLKKDVKEVIDVKEYNLGDWQTINQGLEKLGIDIEMIKNIQKKLSLKVDGKVGPETIAAIKKLGEQSDSESLESESLHDQGLEKEVEKVSTPAWIEKMRGNGGRDVVLMVSDDFDPSKETEVIYHFHGTDGHEFGKLPKLDGASSSYQKRTGKKSVAGNRFQQVANSLSEMKNRNVIIAYPISAGRRGPKKTIAYRNGYDLNWMDREESNEDMSVLHSEVIDSVSKRFGTRVNVTKRTVKGHSAGGLALKNLSKSGFHIDRIDFLDASYGNWAQRCYEEAIKRNPNLQFNLYVRPGTSTDNSKTKSLQEKEGVNIIYTNEKHADMNRVYFGA